MDTENRVGAARDAFMSMDSSDRSYAILDIRTAIIVASGLDLKDDASRVEDTEMREILAAYLAVHDQQQQSTSRSQ